MGQRTSIKKSAVFLCNGGRLADVRFKERRGGIVSFLIEGEDIFEMDLDYRSGIIDSLTMINAGIKNTIPCYGVNGFTDFTLKIRNVNPNFQDYFGMPPLEDLDCFFRAVDSIKNYGTNFLSRLILIG